MDISKRVIVIEDNEDILFVINLILEEIGYRVFKSKSADIIGNLESIKPDLIVLDDKLDDIHGSEICRELKSNSATSHIPVILISAGVDLPATAQECFADGYLEKPFDLKEFEELLRSFDMRNCSRNA